MSDERILTVVSFQARSVAFDPGATLEKLEYEAGMARKGWPEAGLLLWPELYLSGEDPFTGQDPPGFIDRVSVPVPGPLTERLGKIARSAGVYLVPGSVYERDTEATYNTTLVFSPTGELVARHRKLFPWKPWETTTPGKRVTLFDIPQGRVGVMTCYDGWFPEVSRALALGGAELIVQPSLTTTPDRAEELVLARANAIVNQCFLVNVNAASTIGGGRSIGVDPEGHVLFEGGTGEELFVSSLDLGRSEYVREHGTRGLNRLLQHLRESRADGRLGRLDLSPPE
jgi:formamidase